MSKRVGLLLSRNDKDSLVLAIKLLGFKDVNQYLVHLSQILSAKGQLAKSGIFLEKLPLPVLTEANRLASAKLNLKYPVIFGRKPESVKPGAKLLSLGGTDVCTDCHFNNCDECNSNPRDGEQPADDTDGSGASACRASAAAIRAAKINSQNGRLMTALVGCGVTGVGAGVAACEGTLITVIGGPFSPAVGVGTFCVVAVGCASYAIYQNNLDIMVIEAEYSAAISACQ